jgi:oxygen-independent coproporphyrinogen-3 oxidase
LAAHEKFIQPYHVALTKEIKLFAQKFGNAKSTKIKTIFFGGGTPSLYPVDYLEDLFQVLVQCFNLDELLEVTIEANPVDINTVKLAAWKGFGINRLSLGVQVLDDEVLKIMNRPQKVGDVLHAIEIIPNYFENISVDLILGLPGVTLQQWLSTLNTVICWPIKHVSVYMLTVYNKTPMYFKLEKGDLGLESDDALVEMYKLTVDILKNAGFMQYEISNFAKTGAESLHNQAYWMRCSYYGFGLSAASFDGKNRYSNENNLENYIQRIALKHELPISFTESLDSKQEVMEILMLGLRTSKGVDLHAVVYLLKDCQKAEFLNSLEQLEKQRLLMRLDGRIKLTLEGLLIENEVVLRLCDAIFGTC